MSAFGFTDEPVQNSGNDGESLFSFTDEPVDNSGNASEFSFGAAAADAPAPSPFGQLKINQQQPQSSQLGNSSDMFDSTGGAKKNVKKKPASRVIGVKKGKSMKKVPSKPKFAKKDGAAPVKGNLFAKASSAAKGSSMSSDVHESEGASESDNPFAHDSEGSSAANNLNQASDFESLLARHESQQPQNEQVFGNKAETSAFDFGAATENETTNIENAEESAFSFGQETKPEPIQSQTPYQQQNAYEAPSEASMFSFGSSAATPAPQMSSQAYATPPQEEVPADSGLDEDCLKFVRQLAKYSKELEMAQSSYDRSNSSLQEMERQQSEALRNEQFDVADQLNGQISKMRAQMLMSQSSFNKTIADAMTLTNEAPQHFLAHAASAQTELPTLRVRKQALDKRLSNLKEDQQVDQQTIEIERKKNASLIESLKKPIQEHSEAHEQMEIDLKAQIANAKQPFIDTLDDLEKQKLSHEQRIEELKKEIMLHQNEINSIKSQIVSNQKQMKQAEDSFNGDKQNVINDKAALEKERDNLQTRIREIEAPFQNLVDTVEKRETEINGISTAIEKISQQIDDGEKDSKSCETAAGIINKLCQDHFMYSEKRTEAKNKFDMSIKSAKDSEARRNEINDEAIELRGRCQRASEFLNNAKLKVPQLEASKKAAVASKNFKGAQQINKELTSINEQIIENEKLVTQGTQQLEQLEAEASSLTSDIAKAQVEVEETKMNLLQLDYNFFSNANQVMENLVSLSPFGEKLLEPLVSMLIFALEHTEEPKQVSPEELKAELDELTQQQEQAVNNEDYDTAESLQEKINTLQAKLEMCKVEERVVEN
ncbi:myosin heavy chain [Tritrichomonas foetus]|uniref:Myosin heavy chain n=1 Tax=Tritrichomonas foetus TaxID=1144522 RepID=A0A1J4K3L0_9EUKA|nr:myosin heavy chain [Tritrichomonas foetus]|eukprot:OHT05771.1 myosin heavy chain [Tritrichomonas foetus]